MVLIKNIQNNNLAAIIHKHSIDYPKKDAVVFIANNSEISEKITYAELDLKAGILSASLLKHNLINKKVILLYPTSIEFIIAYMACLYAGAISIPLAPPDANDVTRISRFIEAIIKSNDVKIILTNHVTKNFLEENTTLKNRHDLNLLTTDNQDSTISYFRNPTIDPDQIAHIQFSSGTTGLPKGIDISHANLMNSLQVNSNSWKIQLKDSALSWTPPHYIYGLITGILLPLYNGNSTYITPSINILKDPKLWLDILSKYMISYSGCPNFGYELCITKIELNPSYPIDLSNWRIAICGGEIIKAKTLTKFYEKFKHYGFKIKSFCASYGLSEMTGFVSTTKISESPRFLSVDIDALHLNMLKLVNSPSTVLVSCGIIAENLYVKILHPTLLHEVTNQIGEICLAGPTLCKTQNDQLIINNQQAYFKTGDLGVINDNELYVVGRIKDIIIINGKNYSPIDIEDSIRESHPLLVDSVVVASYQAINATEELILLIEMNSEISKLNFDILFNVIRVAVLKYCGLIPHQILLIESGALPKTTSGKLQRNAIKKSYQIQQLPVIHADVYVKAQAHKNHLSEILKLDPVDRKNYLELCIKQVIQNLLNITSESMVKNRFFDLGMTSLLAVEFKECVEEILDRQIQLSASFIFEYPSITAMATYIIDLISSKNYGAENAK